jgi:DNA-binding sugar fermentation-stimulating protein
MLLYKFDKPFIKATIVRRPSKCSYSPYLLDCRLEDGTEVIVHNAALGCCGAIAAGRECYLQPAGSAKTLSSYNLYLIADAGALVCVHPTVANLLAGAIIRFGLLGIFQNIQPEFSVSTSRFDFGAMSGDRVALFEVKSVPIAANGVAAFPVGERPLRGANLADGSRLGEKYKSKSQPISPRAIKQIELLQELAAAGANCNIIYIIGRPDVNTLKVGEQCRFYRVASEAATDVKKWAFSVRWSVDGSCHLAGHSLIGETGEMTADAAGDVGMMRLMPWTDADCPGAADLK